MPEGLLDTMTVPKKAGEQDLIRQNGTSPEDSSRRLWGGGTPPLPPRSLRFRALICDAYCNFSDKLSRGYCASNKANNIKLQANENTFFPRAPVWIPWPGPGVDTAKPSTGPRCGYHYLDKALA